MPIAITSVTTSSSDRFSGSAMFICESDRAALGGETLSDLLRERNDDTFRTTDVGQLIRFPVPHFADQLRAVLAHVRYQYVDVIDGEHDAAQTQCVHRRVDWTEPDRVRRVELVQLDALPIRRSQHRK